MSNIQESGRPIFRATSPLGRVDYPFTFVRMTLPLKRSFELFLLLINQLSRYGAVAELCEEYESTMFYSDRVLEITKQTYSLVESADLLNVQKPSQADEKEQGDLLHIHKERAENLPDDEKLTKLSADEGFVKAVGSGQFFMTKGY